MQERANNFKKLKEDGRVKRAIIGANNHLAGFGPLTEIFLGTCWQHVERGSIIVLSILVIAIISALVVVFLSICTN